MKEKSCLYCTISSWKNDVFCVEGTRSKQYAIWESNNVYAQIVLGKDDFWMPWVKCVINVRGFQMNYCMR